MPNLFTTRIAAIGLLLIQSLVIIFHLLVMVGVIPFNIVWGGRLKNTGEMHSFEAVSVLMNLVMVAVVAIKADILRLSVNRTVIQVALWGMFFLFLLNTLGNIFSNNYLEKIIFTPLTFLLAIFSLRLAINKEPKPAY